MPFYAVARGRTIGIFNSWPDCESQVKGFSGARYKKFDTVVAAQDFIDTVAGGTLANTSKRSSNDTKNPSNNSLKRSYSTSSYSNQKSSTSNYKRNAQRNSAESDENSDTYTDSDDLNTIMTKQLDDIEDRLKKFEKGINKIIKSNTKSSSRKTIVIDPPQAKRKRASNKMGFEEDSDGYVQVYTDGACSLNGRQGARAGLGVYWGDNHALNVSEPVSGRATNNCGEIQAATRAIKIARQNGIEKLTINTDSKFLIDSVTKWMPGWKQKGWKLKSGGPVKNEEDFKDLDRVQHEVDVKWNYVEAHRGVHGNEMADNLAKAGAAQYNIKN